MRLFKSLWLCILVCLCSCNHREDVSFTGGSDGVYPERTTPEDTAYTVPVYEYEYHMDVPVPAAPATGNCLLFISWDRCDECPSMIHFGKDVKIQ